MENELAILQENAMVVNAQREKLKRFNSMENELISLREEVAIYRYILLFKKNVKYFKCN